MEATTGARPPRAARLAVAAMFLVAGAGQGTWVVRIPDVQRALDLSPGALGLALFGLPLGLLGGVPVGGWAAVRWGSRPVTVLAALGYCAALPTPALAASAAWLLVALVAFGAASGALDVAMNTQAVAVEARYERPIMSSFHAVFSGGGLLGSAAGGAVASLGIAPLPHLTAAAVVLGATSLVAAGRLLPATVESHGHPGRRRVRPSGKLVALGAFAFVVLLSEGAVADWSAVFLRQVRAAEAGLAGLGFAAFSLAMALGRLAGDSLRARLGPVALLRGGAVLAAAGMTLAVAPGSVPASIVGFALVGAGLSTLFPVVLGVAGRSSDAATGAVIATVTLFGYVGFLVGPPLIGLLADVEGLRAALAVVALLCLLLIPLAARAGDAPRPSS
ncbi:MAG: MFS transporter [Sphaerobacter sp.]|nr:MFS transporter [Sphaerobacter sp.]